MKASRVSTSRPILDDLLAGLLLGIHPPPVFGRLAVPYYEAHRAMIKQGMSRAGCFLPRISPNFLIAIAPGSRIRIERETGCEAPPSNSSIHSF
jgi:hypothetical protein